MTTGEWIKSVRKEAELTQTDFGARIGEDRFQISRLEKGNIRLTQELENRIVKTFLVPSSRQLASDFSKVTDPSTADALTFQQRSSLATKSFYTPLVLDQCLRQLNSVFQAACRTDNVHTFLLAFSRFMDDCVKTIPLTQAQSGNFSLRDALRQLHLKKAWLRVEKLRESIRLVERSLRTGLSATQRSKLLDQRRKLEARCTKELERIQAGKITDSELWRLARDPKAIGLPDGRIMRITADLDLDQIISTPATDTFQQFWEHLFAEMDNVDRIKSDDGVGAEGDYIYPIPFELFRLPGRRMDCRVPKQINLDANSPEAKSLRVEALEYAVGRLPFLPATAFRPVRKSSGIEEYACRVPFETEEIQFLQILARDQRDQTILSPVYCLHESGVHFVVKERGGTLEEQRKACIIQLEGLVSKEASKSVSKTVSKGVRFDSRKQVRALRNSSLYPGK